MATEIQYKVCKETYDEELKRYTELTEKGKTLLGICTFFIGGSAYKLDDVLRAGPGWSHWVFAVAIVLLGASFVMIVRSLGIYPYEAMFDVAEYIESLGPAPPKDDEFLRQRIADISVANARNAAQNEKRVWFLEKGCYVLFAAILVGFVSMFLAFVGR
jgi:hypothetical protein